MLTYKHPSLSDNFSPIQRLAWPLAISLIMHACVLSQINWNTHYISAQPRLTVHLTHLSPALPEKTVQIRSHAPEHVKRERSAEERETGKIPKLAATSGLKISEKTALLNTEELLKQVKDYAKKEYRIAEPTPDIDGEYYGTYNGYDKGSFSIHLDGTGNVSGSGQSDKLDAISFIIRGKVAPNGLIEMLGLGIIEGARFTGKLDIKTRKFSGSWSWGVATGSFSGQHE